MPSIDLQSFHLSDSEDAAIPSTVGEQSMSGPAAMTPIRFDEAGGNISHQLTDVVAIHQELNALRGYHRNVENRSSSVRY